MWRSFSEASGKAGSFLSVCGSPIGQFGSVPSATADARQTLGPGGGSEPGDHCGHRGCRALCKQQARRSRGRRKNSGPLALCVPELRTRARTWSTAAAAATEPLAVATRGGAARHVACPAKPRSQQTPHTHTRPGPQGIVRGLEGSTGQRGSSRGATAPVCGLTGRASPLRVGGTNTALATAQDDPDRSGATRSRAGAIALNSMQLLRGMVTGGAGRQGERGRGGARNAQADKGTAVNAKVRRVHGSLELDGCNDLQHRGRRGVAGSTAAPTGPSTRSRRSAPPTQSELNIQQHANHNLCHNREHPRQPRAMGQGAFPPRPRLARRTATASPPATIPAPWARRTPRSPCVGAAVGASTPRQRNCVGTELPSYAQALAQRTAAPDERFAVSPDVCFFPRWGLFE